MLSNRKLFASALLNKIIYVTKFTYFYIKLPLFMLQNVVEGGGHAPPLDVGPRFVKYT
jgi:hypothetical protein